MGYNDDVAFGHFQRSEKRYAGKQRRGGMGERVECLSILGHVDAALASPFAFRYTPRCPGILRVRQSSFEIPPNSALSFWNDQLNKLNTLILAAITTEHTWRRAIAAQIDPAAGELQLAALTRLTERCGLGGANWMKQFLYGLKMVGRMTRRGRFPPSEKERREKHEKIRKYFATMNPSSPTEPGKRGGKR